MSDDDLHQQWISKSQRKRECNALQKIGDRLLKLSPDQLELIDLPPELIDALNEAHRIRSNSALKRQRQYLGKIMRNCDSTKIEQELNAVLHKNDTNAAQFKKLEKWRDRLVENDGEVMTEILNELPDLDRHHVHNLVRQAAREASADKPPAASRKLFKYLREMTEEHGS